MLHPILSQVPINFFSEAFGEPPHAATGKAPTDEQAEPLVQPPAADHRADSAHGQRSASKALPRGDVSDQAQLYVPHACACKPAKLPPPRAEVFAIKAEVARGLARLTALSGMAEPQWRKLSCTYCQWDRQPRHTVERCLHKLGCCVCGQTHKGCDCDHLPVDVKAGQEVLKRVCAQVGLFLGDGCVRDAA